MESENISMQLMYEVANVIRSLTYLSLTETIYRKWTQEHATQLDVATISQIRKRERERKERINVIKAASVPDFLRFRCTLTRHNVTNQMFFISKNNKSEWSASGKAMNNIKDRWHCKWKMTREKKGETKFIWLQAIIKFHFPNSINSKRLFFSPFLMIT